MDPIVSSTGSVVALEGEGKLCEKALALVYDGSCDGTGYLALVSVTVTTLLKLLGLRDIFYGAGS